MIRKRRKHYIFSDTIELLTLSELKRKKLDVNNGVLFCFGSSLISQIIRAKTREYVGEIVPSHVALVYGGYIYESTTEEVNVHKKHIPAGVRRWQVQDFYISESKKDTLYYFYKTDGIDTIELENNVHRPYGKDTIVDYLLADDSKGNSNGLICSQYANLCTKFIDKPCVTPAELYRAVKEMEQ